MGSPFCTFCKLNTMAALLALFCGCTPFIGTVTEDEPQQSYPCPYNGLMETLACVMTNNVTLYWHRIIASAPHPGSFPDGISKNYHANYVDGYRKGYAFVLCGYGYLSGLRELEPHPLHEAFLRGWRDGVFCGDMERFRKVFKDISALGDKDAYSKYNARGVTNATISPIDPSVALTGWCNGHSVFMNRETSEILDRDDAAELAKLIDAGASPNFEYGACGTVPEELALPLLRYAVSSKAEKCVRLLLDRGASVTRPDGFNKIAIQWAEEEGTTRIADMIERANTDTNILLGLEITNAVMRLCPPGSLAIPPDDVPLVVVSEDEKTFGQAMGRYADAFQWPKHFSVLGVSTNGPYPTFEYQMRSEGGLRTFGGMLSRHRGFYVITNTWVCDH